MDQQQFDLSGLAEEQKLAIGEMWKNHEERIFNGTTLPDTIKSFLRANKMKKSSDADEARRGTRYEQDLFALCRYSPKPQ